MIESTGQLSTRVGVLRDLGLTARLLLLFPALAVMSVAAEVVCLDLLYYQDPDAQDPSFTARTLSSIGLLAWNAVLPAAIVALLVLTARCWPRGIPVAVGICMLLSCAVVTLLVSMMAGPDAFDGLVLLLLPSRCFQTELRAPRADPPDRLREVDDPRLSPALGCPRSRRGSQGPDVGEGTAARVLADPARRGATVVPMTSPVADHRTTGTSGDAGTEARGTLLRRALSMGVLRFANVAGSTSLVSALTYKGSAGTAVDGVAALLLMVGIVGLWSAVDAGRQALAGPIIAWSSASVLLVAAAPLTLTLSYQAGEGGWTGPGAYVAAVWGSAGSVLALTAVPAAAGLAVGRLIRKSQAVHPPSSCAAR